MREAVEEVSCWEVLSGRHVLEFEVEGEELIG